MKTKKEIGVFKFRDSGNYKIEESLKNFSQYLKAENYADKCWQKDPCYGGYIVINTGTQIRARERK